MREDVSSETSIENWFSQTNIIVDVGEKFIVVRIFADISTRVMGCFVILVILVIREAQVWQILECHLQGQILLIMI